MEIRCWFSQIRDIFVLQTWHHSSRTRQEKINNTIHFRNLRKECVTGNRYARSKFSHYDHTATSAMLACILSIFNHSMYITTATSNCLNMQCYMWQWYLQRTSHLEYAYMLAVHQFCVHFLCNSQMQFTKMLVWDRISFS